MKRFRDWPLRRKLLGLVVASGILPILVTAVIQFRLSQEIIEDGAEQLLSARAEGLALQIDELHASFNRATDRLSIQPAVRRFLESTAGAQRSRDEIAQILRAYSDRGTDKRMRGVALFDAAGTVVATGDGSLVGRNYGNRKYVREALQGLVSSPQLFATAAEAGESQSIAYARPVKVDDKVVGIAVLYANAQALWDLVRSANGKAGEGSFAEVLDELGIRIADSSDRALLFRPAARLPAIEVERLAAERRFGDMTRTLLQETVALEGASERARSGAPPGNYQGFAEANQQQNLISSRRLANAPWTLFFLLPIGTVNSPVQRLLSSTLLASLGAMVLAALLATWLTNPLVAAVRQLSGAAHRMRAGDLSVQVPVSSRDDLGVLGESFNDMAMVLAASQEELEEKVRRRTEALGTTKDDLQRQNAALAQRTAELTERQDRDTTFARTLAALSGPGHLREVLGTALGEAEDYLHTLVLACYRLEQQQLIPVAARGGVASNLRVAGRIAEALAAHKPVLLDALPEDAELRFEAGLAAGRPKSVVIVPLTMGDRDVGVLAAGLGKRPSQQQIAFLVELALPLALAMGRHELHEQTERFALQLAQRNEVLRDQSEQLASKQTELEQKNTEIGRANQLKSEFLANMSHELRTPLNAVIGFSELMLEDAAKLLPDHVQFVKDILASGKHLLTLINSVLDLAKIEAGRVALEVEPLDTRQQVVAACALVSGMALKKSLRVEQAIHASRSVRADASKLQQILLNLLSNAIKFSEPGKRIEVGVQDQGEMLRFWVRDEGPGIPDSVKSELFQPFVHGESPLVKKHEGTGLGLAITKRLVEYQGGEVGVDTELGRGSTFWFLLPADARMAAPSSAPAPRRETAPNGHGSTTQDRPLVLVVEDDPANARLLRFHLENAGYAVAEARREREALELARRLKPQVVLLDLILSDGEEGTRVLRQLKSNPLTEKVPVVVVSVVQETQRAIELGAVECFVKPIDANQVLEVVQRLCPAVPTVHARATVLVVDDHEMNRELARTLLERRGCRVLLARNGQEGARVAKVEQPDLVLMDLAMPVKDGITAARELKADPETSKIPLIAFTALAMRGDEERARKAGFDGYLTKPLEIRALDDTLEKFLIPQARA